MLEKRTLVTPVFFDKAKVHASPLIPLSYQPKPSDFMAAIITMATPPTIIVYSMTRVVDLLSRTRLGVLIVMPPAVLGRSRASIGTELH
jgi:hypothetical protein